MSAGSLVLVATPIGNLGDLSPRALAVLGEADIVCCEDTRHTGRLLARSQTSARRLVSLHAHNEGARITMLLDELSEGRTVALVSDAGTPLISDPGNRLVKAAIAAGVVVSVVPGPTAAIAALVVSGLSTDRWRFEGFLERKGRDRKARIADIARSPVPSICYEAPHRLGATLGDLAAACGPDRLIVLARELTKLHEEVWRGPLHEAVRRTAEHEPRGEYVLVVDASPAPAEVQSADLADAISKLCAAGLARRDAVIAVEQLLGVPHRVAYDAALGVKDGERRRAETPDEVSRVTSNI